jgi:hypothetical protein
VSRLGEVCGGIHATPVPSPARTKWRRVDDQVELFIAEHRQVGHVALDPGQVQPIPLSDRLILGQFTARGIDHDDLSARRCQYRPVLPAAAGQAQDAPAADIAEPLPRHRLGIAQMDPPTTLPRLRHLLSRNWLGLRIPLRCRSVPSALIRLEHIHDFILPRPAPQVTS